MSWSAGQTISDHYLTPEVGFWSPDLPRLSHGISATEGQTACAPTLCLRSNRAPV